jgi:hypothetical protein
MTAHPWRTVRLWPDKLMHTFGRATDGPYWAFQKTANQLTVPGAGDDKQLYLRSRSYASIYHSSLMIVFVVSVPMLLRLRSKIGHSMSAPALPIAIVLYTALVSCLFFGNPRFAFPVMPYVTMYAAGLLVMVWQSLAPQRETGLGDGPSGPVA